MLGRLKKETSVFVVTKIYPNDLRKIEKIFATESLAFNYAHQNNGKEGCHYVVECLMLEG